MSKTASIDAASGTYRRRRHNIVANVVKIVTQEHSRKAYSKVFLPPPLSTTVAVMYLLPKKAEKDGDAFPSLSLFYIE